MEPPALRAVVIQRDQRSQPAAIDVIHARQVENDAPVLRNQLFYRLPQLAGLFAKHNAAETIDDQNLIHDSSAQSQLHDSPSAGLTRRPRLKAYSQRGVFRKGLSFPVNQPSPRFPKLKIFHHV